MSYDIDKSTITMTYERGSNTVTVDLDANGLSYDDFVEYFAGFSKTVGYSEDTIKRYLIVDE